ncbi:MAG TPA: hypothetical protein VFB67_10810 [Candidatus Polarisedimenticolaceae bacterium]|nr:hypothetical protein [Candidatus Polarisedimenticolaceae bacterium]
MVVSTVRRLVLGLAVGVLCAAATPAADDGPPVARTGGLLRAQWNYPGKAQLGFGAIVGHMPEDFDCKTTCLFRGATLQAAAGLGAGELSIGYASLVGETGRGDWLLRHVYYGYGVRAAVVRTWGSSTLDPEGATFAGVEGAFTIAQVGWTLGVFRRLESVPGKSDWRVFGGMGWGF